MKKNDSDELLIQVLGGVELDNLRRATLECGLSGLRRRRARRQMAGVAGLICLLLLAAGMVVQSLAGRRAATVARWQASIRPDQGVKIISDEELFALFPDRPLALVGKPGHQQLVFLDGFINQTPITR